MKTIEERARAFANERWPKENFKSNDRYRREHYQKSRDTYIAIATEQRSIDIEKACGWLKTNLWNYYVSSSQADNCGIDDENLLDSFRKAMEE